MFFENFFMKCLRIAVWRFKKKLVFCSIVVYYVYVLAVFVVLESRENISFQGRKALLPQNFLTTNTSITQYYIKGKKMSFKKLQLFSQFQKINNIFMAVITIFYTEIADWWPSNGSLENNLWFNAYFIVSGDMKIYYIGS